MRVGDYETVLDLGRGGMADLFIARPRGGGEVVILKMLRPPATDKRVTLFRDEARLALLLDHPNVVRTYRVGEDDGRHFIALELLDGQPLDRILQRLRSLGRHRDGDVRTLLLSALAEALAGLHHAHELGQDGAPLHIVHRDFTPQNLFVTYDGRVKTLDFGIAKSAGRMARTTSGDIRGKVRYMAPEQALGLRVDRRADIFAAGVVLYELASGAPLWTNPSETEVFDDLVGGDYPLALPDASPALNAVLGKALARDASERYRTAAQMREELREAATLPGALGAATAQLMNELFAEQRARTEAMLARALAV